MNSTPTRLSLGDGLRLGILAGICHAVAEGYGFGVYGISLTARDVLLLALSYAAVGFGFGVVLYIVLRKSDAGVAWALRFLVLVYLTLGAVRLLQPSASATTVLLLLFLLALAAVVATRARGAAAWIPACMTLALAGTGSTLLATQWGEIAQAGLRLGLALALLLPSLLFLVLALRARAWMAGWRAGFALFAAHVLLTALIWPAQVLWYVQQPAPAPQQAAADRPNVLLVVLDTVRAQNMDLFGYVRETMPQLTRFAEEECDLSMPVLSNGVETLPSHASMFTGQFVYSHGAHKPYLFERDVSAVYLHALDERHETLAGWLGGAGYRTAAISANIGQVAGYGLERGFQHFDCVESATALARKFSWLFSIRWQDRGLGTALMYRLPDSIKSNSLCFSRNQPGYRRAERIRSLATRWLEGNGDEPFFLFLNFLDAHDPYMPLEPYRQRFVDPTTKVDWVGFPFELWRAALHNGAEMPEADLRHARALYDSELLYLDEQLDELFAALRAAELYDDTLIVVVGDHGEEFWEHGAMLHGGNVYQTQAGVPLLIKLPAQSGELSVEPAATMQQLDLIPTIAELLDLPAPEDLQGSAWGLGRDYAMAENFVHWARGEKFHRELVGIKIGSFKYIRSTDGTEELYDLSLDLNEHNDIASEHPEIVERARVIAEARDAHLKMILEDLPLDSLDVEDERTLERLRALGYID